MDTSVTSLNITSIGSGYGDGNLSASGEGGPASGNLPLWPRNRISISNFWRFRYASGTVFNVACGRDCPGSGPPSLLHRWTAQGNTGIVLTSHGSKYTTDHVLTLDNTGSSGRQADISVTLNATGHLAVAEIETGSGIPPLPRSSFLVQGLEESSPLAWGDHSIGLQMTIQTQRMAACIEGGHIIDLGQDLDNDGILDPTE